MDLKDWQDWNHWKIQQLHISFQADFIYFVSQIYWFFEVWGNHFSSILGLVTPLFHYFGDHWVQGCTQMGPEFIFSDFWWILGRPLETILDHFFIFSLIWAVQNHIWIAVTFFADFWMEILVNSDVLILQKSCKYACFHYISLFQNFRFVGDFGYLLGPHLGDFWRSWELIFVIFWCIGYALKFHWFSGPPQAERPRLVEGKLVHQGVQ